jgi:hypothetical protein
MLGSYNRTGGMRTLGTPHVAGLIAACCIALGLHAQDRASIQRAPAPRGLQ